MTTRMGRATRDERPKKSPRHVPDRFAHFNPYGGIGQIFLRGGLAAHEAIRSAQNLKKRASVRWQTPVLSTSTPG